MRVIRMSGSLFSRGTARGDLRDWTHRNRRPLCLLPAWSLPDRPHGGGRLWFGLYLLVAAFVCSFVGFEVLDLDGSDLPLSPVQATVRCEEPSCDEMKRMILHRVPWAPIIAVLQDISDSSPPIDDVIGVRPSTLAPSRSQPLSFPRSSVADIPAAA